MLLYSKTYEKRPGERKSFDVSFAKALATSLGAGGIQGDPIASFTVDYESGIAVDLSLLMQPDVVRLWVIGGLDGRYYAITVTATTSLGRVVQAAVRVRVRGQGIPPGLPIDAGGPYDYTNLAPIDAGEA